MKENPEDRPGTESLPNKVVDSPPTAPLADSEIADVDGSAQDSYQLNPLEARQGKLGKSPQAPPIVYIPPVASLYRPGIAAPPAAIELEGIAANGGAVGALVLGIWSILGSLLTFWSLINGILGLALGIWGLRSKRPRMAWIGIFLCLVGASMSLLAVSEMISVYWNAAQDPYNL